MSILIGFLWVVIVIVMLVLAGVILLQEGKGGGFAEAFGGVGAETFGVKASGINRFTGILGAVFIVLVVAINLCYRDPGDEVLIPEQQDPSINSLLEGLGPDGTGGGEGAGGNGGSVPEESGTPVDDNSGNQDG